MEYLKYTTPGFVYSVGISPANAAAALAAIELMLQEPQRVAAVQKNARTFLEAAKARGFDTGLSESSAVVTIITGNSAGALLLADKLFTAGCRCKGASAKYPIP